MMHPRLVLALALSLSGVFAQTPFDEPIQRAVSDPATLVAAVDAAQEHLFALSPQLASVELADALARARSRGVRVYLVVQRQESYAPEVLGLANQGVEVRTLPTLSEGVMVADYRHLYEGGFVSGSQKETQYLDINTFGSTFIDQFRALWQAAEPLGGSP